MNYSLENISDYISVSISRLREEKRKEVLLFFTLCVAINLIGGIDISTRRLLYLDMLGTALAGIALGPWWGASVGLVTNILLYLMLPSSPNLLVFSIVNILGGLYWGYLCNLKLLKPLEGLLSIQKIMSLNHLKSAFKFVILSGGLFLSIPSIIILTNELGAINHNTTFIKYFYYITINITDKLLCIVIATIVIFSFFPALGSHLINEEKQINYGASVRSISWFLGMYIVPSSILFKMYPSEWYLWILPIILALISINYPIKGRYYPDFQCDINLSHITYSGLFWIIIISIITFVQYVYFAIYNVSSKFNIYNNNGIVLYKNIFIGAFSLSLVVVLIGIVFVVLIEALKQRENKEILRRVESAKDKIATEIHNDPLQLISVLMRKVSTCDSQIKKMLILLDELKHKNYNIEDINKFEIIIKDFNKTFSNYYALYLPQLDSNIRKIIMPLTQKGNENIITTGLIQSIKDLFEDFKSRNTHLKIFKNIELDENELPKSRSDNNNWKIEVIKILRELLNNIEKHSEADTITLDIKINQIKPKKNLLISITDNGKGFNPEHDNINPNSFGIYEIKTRSRYIGANLLINYINISNINRKGTIINLEIPYDF